MCKTVLGSLREPSDFAGLPVVREHGVTLEAPAWAKELVAGGGGYLFLDELTTSPPAVQAAMLAVALDLTVGGCDRASSVTLLLSGFSYVCTTFFFAA